MVVDKVADTSLQHANTAGQHRQQQQLLTDGKPVEECERHGQPLAASARFTTRRASASRRELILKCALSAATRFTSNCSVSRSNEKLMAPPSRKKSSVSPTVRTPAPSRACRSLA